MNLLLFENLISVLAFNNYVTFHLLYTVKYEIFYFMIIFLLSLLNCIYLRYLTSVTIIRLGYSNLA